MSIRRLFVSTRMPVVFDASPLINLVGTQMPKEILKLLPHPLLVPKEVESDLGRGATNGHTNAPALDEFRADGLVRVVQMGQAAMGIFQTLVAGSAQDSLDDGEAATIACAIEVDGIAIIDEAKALRICRTRFPDLEVVSTAGLLLHASVERTLGRGALSDCLFGALRQSRMRVPSELLEEVVRCLGDERASQCVSLPRKSRRLSSS